MECSKCGFNNKEAANFCLECGESLELKCPRCGKTLPVQAKFCNECGKKLMEFKEEEKKSREAEGERKNITVLFSDLSGYTAMSERLDPEEVKEIMSRIFGEIAQVVTKYEGFIEKFVGDAVLALFGVPSAHEDDPVRAIRAAKEIHDLIEDISPKFEKKIGQPLRMHTGIHTGLVVTGKVDFEKGTHDISGDTINLAFRLVNLAKAGEVLVTTETYRQAEGYFTFQNVETAKVKGKIEPLKVYRVSSVKERPITVHRLSGLKADLIGRKMEMNQLTDTVKNLRKGEGKIISICGDAGTGKSRLVEEFKTTLDLNEVQWLEGHAYSYSQNIPYFPLINMLNSAFQIEEGDPPEKIKGKIEYRIEYLVGQKKGGFPYIGSLYNLSYPEIENVSPESWKAQLQEEIQTVLAAVAQRAPAVICLEDLQWADPSSLELLSFLLSEFMYPILFLCVYRPSRSLFKSYKLEGMKKKYLEIRLQDLSPAETQDMLESILKAKTIPLELRRFIQEKVEGNPFYLEEVINSLIESETLSRSNGRWKLIKPIHKTDVPATIHGVISARLDRLDRDSKRILQEASVIGRAFHYDILKKITEQQKYTDQYLKKLVRLDLIRIKSLQPDLEYVFKHVLTQEVAYEGLLKKERQLLHEKIALVMEQLFQNRLPEFYETLAFHSQKSGSVHKAVNYLVKSGDKGAHRYAVEESHRYYGEAFDILFNKPAKTVKEKQLLIDILLKWAFVFHYRGDFKELTKLLILHQDLAESMEDKARFEMLLGFSLGFGSEEFKKAYNYLSDAITLGEKTKNRQIIGYASSWLSLICAEMGLVDEAIVFGKRAQEISKQFPSDHYLYFSAMSGIGQAHWHRGNIKNGTDVGKALLDYGQQYSDIRSTVRGHYFMGWGHFIEGEFSSAIDSFQHAIQISTDPYHSQLPRLGLIYSYVATDQFGKTHAPLQELLSFTERFGVDMLATPAQALSGLVMVAEGQLKKGIKKFQKAQHIWQEKQRRCLYAASEYMMGRVYLKIGERGGDFKWPMIAKNIVFLITNAPFALKKAEKHFMKSIHVAKKIGAKSTLGRACLDLGLLYKKKQKKDRAIEYVSTAIIAFERCGAQTYLSQAKEALASLI